MMNRSLTPIDIRNMPDLRDLVAEVEAANTPRELRLDNKPVAILTPIQKPHRTWETINAAFGAWSDIDAKKNDCKHLSQP